LRDYAGPDNVFFLVRHDVHKHLQQQGRNCITTHHGFSIVVPISTPKTSGKYTIFIEKHGELINIGDFSLTEMIGNLDSAAFYLQAHSADIIPEINFFKKIIKPLISQKISEPTYNILSFVDSAVSARVSVIVPLFGDWFFLRSLLIMQEAMPHDFEWIYICDDPSIAVRVIKYITSRTKSLSRTTKLVINDRNYGYSISNNIGFSVSDADCILFMNSDIWIMDPDPIHAAINAIREGLYSIIGFRLLFEDGSLQHDGISFERNPAYHNLYLAEHFNKGLPPASLSNAIVECEAVTGALMMIDRRSFDKVGKFDQIYVKGDFEDADLCLKIHESGAKVGIVRSNSIYHLERQSIRRLPSKSLRQAITMCNCLTFNERWSSHIARVWN
jgi:hypothetical protein